MSYQLKTRMLNRKTKLVNLNSPLTECSNLMINNLKLINKRKVNKVLNATTAKNPLDWFIVRRWNVDTGIIRSVVNGVKMLYHNNIDVHHALKKNKLNRKRIVNKIKRRRNNRHKKKPKSKNNWTGSFKEMFLAVW